MLNRARSYAVCILLLLLVTTGCGGRTASAPASIDIPGNLASTASTSSSPGLSNISYHRLESIALEKTMGLAVYLPPGYNPANRYPVLYIMYGYGGNEYSMFNNVMNVNRTADRLISEGSMPPMILVVPDYDNSFAVNSTLAQKANSGGGSIGLYEDYLIREVIPYIDRHFSTDNTRTGRFIDGYSMGGFAALYLGFNYPDLFSKIGAHSSALWDYSTNDLFTGQRDWLYATPALRAQRDPFLLARSQDLRNIDIYLDVGSNDALFGINQRFYRHLLKQGIQVQWHSNTGRHDVNYWSANTENYFLFY